MHGVLAQESGPIQAVFGSFEDTFLWVILGVSLIALVFAYYLVREVLAAPEGTPKMKEIATAIQEGAKAYLSRQFRTLGIFLGILTVVLFFILPAPDDAVHSEFSIKFGRSLAFILGAVFSATTGYVGMWLAVRANVRTANAARESGLKSAMRIAFRSGGVAGMFTVGLGLLGATLILIIYKQDATSVLLGFGFGGALLAMFMRVGGGIFTKAADVGADLVGKVEQGIPEDDPRNAATIADNVGDNVGDCAGMAADLFESYEVTLVASLILGAAAYSQSEIGAIAGVMFPLFVRAVGVVTSIIGILAVAPRSEDEHGMKAINRGFFISALVSAAATFVISKAYMDSYRPGLAVAIGLVLASVIQVLTQHFTDTKHRPVQEIAESTVTGPATTILSGFSSGLESTVWSIIVIAGAMMSAFLLGNSTAERLYFIALTGMGMLTTVGVIVSMDTFGPISDNAQGIAEMSGEFEGRPAEILGGLDAIGNSTKAITKGMAIATAVIAATSSVRVVRGGPEGRRFRLPGHPCRPSQRARRPAARGLGRVPVLITRDPRGGSCGRAGRCRGAEAVPRTPGDHGLHGEARVQPRGRHLHQDLAPRADDAGPARRPRARDRRLLVRGGGVRRIPGGRHPDRTAARRHALQLRRSLGQRQEVHRGGALRWQGERGP